MQLAPILALMIRDLPPPDKRQLANSPLELVVCRLNFEMTLAVADVGVAQDVHAALGGRDGPYPVVSQMQSQGLNVALAPAGPAVSPVPNLSGWRFASADEAWVISLMPDHVAIETSQYTTWEDDFRSRLGALLTAVGERIEPKTEQRLGLRYVDRVKGLPVEHPDQWGDWIHPHLVGALTHPQLGPGVLASRQHLLLEVAEDVKCGLGHGFLADPEEGGQQVYLLDYDLFRDRPRTCDIPEILKAADTFSEVGLQIFHASITAELLERLR